MISYIMMGVAIIVMIVIGLMFAINKSIYRCGHNEDLTYKCPVCDESIPDDATKENETFYCYCCGTKLRKDE